MIWIGFFIGLKSNSKFVRECGRIKYMKKIKGTQKIYTIIETEPKIRDVLVALGMSPIAKDTNLNTIGRIVDLNQAIKQVGVDEETVQKEFKKIGVEVDFNE